MKSQLGLQIFRISRPLQGIFFRLFCFLTLVACAQVGPDFHPPVEQLPAQWHNEAGDGLVVGHLDPGNLARWWSNFNDPALSALVDRAVEGNLDLQLAHSRLREARARLGVSKAGELPALTASASATHSHSNRQDQNLFAVGFDAGWELDIFGGVRRSLEAAKAELAADNEDLRDVLVSLLGEVAINYLDARTYQSRLAAAMENLRLQEETAQLAEWRYRAGLSDELAVQQARYNLEATRAQLSNLRTGLEASLNRLAVLTGDQPGMVHEFLRKKTPLPVPSIALAVGVPAEALRQRPDLRRAEQQLAAATARIGVAMSDLYPKFRLSGSISLDSVDSANILAPVSRSWRLGPSFSWPLFDGGEIRSNIEVQSALQEQKLIQYRSVVLAALEEVENALAAYREERVRHQAITEAAQAAGIAAQLAQDKYRAGLEDFGTVLDAQRSQLSFEDQMAQSQGAICSDLVRLYKALGGGWQSLATDMGDSSPDTMEQ